MNEEFDQSDENEYGVKIGIKLILKFASFCLELFLSILLKKFEGRLYERSLRISHTPCLYNDGSQEYYNSHFIDLEISTVSKTFARYLTNLTTS